jgi:nitrogen fixation NifU-like protein
MNADFYREEILDHFKNPRNFGELANADKRARAVNSLCGDEIKISIKLANDRNHVADIRFSGTGCAISMAAASMLTEQAKGKKLGEIKSWGRKDVLESLGIKLSPTRLKCALLPLEALHKALSFD